MAIEPTSDKNGPTPSSDPPSNGKDKKSAAAASADPLSSTPLSDEVDAAAERLVGPSLCRLTFGLPRHELRIISREALEAEEALAQEIRILEEAAGIVGDPSSPSSSLTAAAESTADATKASSGPSSSSSAGGGAAAAGGWMAYDTTGSGTGPAYLTSVDAMLTTELTPPDRFYTVSALLGRLRDPIDTPPPPNSTVALARRRKAQAAASGSGTKKSSSKKGGGGGGSGAGGGGTTAAEKAEAERRQKRKLIDKQQALLALETNPIYRKEQTETAPLLALWKRISSHRTATVFRKPVNAREAPGYADKILFPIDLNLIRKMITSGIIVSFADLHERIGLICHNCVKFNGRESDYGVVTREFELYVDDSVVAAVTAASEATAAAAKKSSGYGGDAVAAK